jgi:Helitron helicase-like domain at N-terminus
MYQLYQDSMVIVRTCGKPDLFITMTCNPKWLEIVEALLLLGRVGPQDRPDVVARVFKLKLNDSLLHDLYKSHVFGHTLAHVWHVIEFQKQGLPHILLILDRNHKP